MSEQFHDRGYLDMMKRVLDTGVRKSNRTGVDTISTFAQELQFDLSDGTIPLLTSKKMHTKSIIHELLWFLSGSTDNNLLKEKGISIWNEWETESGDLPKIYGYQWRHWPGYELIDVNYWPEDGETFDPEHPTDCLITGTVKLKFIDQIALLIDKLRNNPNDRRLIVSAWNVADLDKMALPPCHAFFQFYVANGELSCKLTQRSADVFLGVPFNIAQYSILVHMIAKITGLRPGRFIWSGGDVHIYTNHLEQCSLQLSRDPYASPKLVIDGDQKEIEDFRFEDFRIVGYESHPTIKAEVAV